MNGVSSGVDQFVGLLQKYPSSELVSNPWTDHDGDFDINGDAPHKRSNHLRAYLNARLNTAEALLIAEAPGYQEAKFSGIPMTCERTLLGRRDRISVEHVFDDTIKPQRTSCSSNARSKAVEQWGFCEPTASYVWPVLADRGLSKKIVLWNIFAFHPHKETTLTNRPPKDREISSEDNRNVLDAFLRLFPDLPILAIGKKSKNYLTRWEYKKLSIARHPAYGGGAEFRKDFDKFLRTAGLV